MIYVNQMLCANCQAPLPCGTVDTGEVHVHVELWILVIGHFAHSEHIS